MSNQNLNQLNDRNFKHQHRERLCYCCDTLQESKDQICIYKIEGRGHGSSFTGLVTEIHLCDKCKHKAKVEWFTEKPTINKHNFEIYQYEENIIELVENFSPYNQEYIYNGQNVVYPKQRISREEWLGISENNYDNVLINEDSQPLFDGYKEACSQQIILNNNNNIKANYIN